MSREKLELEHIVLAEVFLQNMNRVLFLEGFVSAVDDWDEEGNSTLFKEPYSEWLEKQCAIKCGKWEKNELGQWIRSD